MLQRMHAAQTTDSSRRTGSGRKSNSRKSLRDLCRKLLRSINPEDPSSRPIKLDLLTFKIFARFLSTFKKSVKKRKRSSADNMDIQYEEVQIRLGISSFDGACSALSHLYLECGLDKEVISKELWSKLSTYKKGTRRKYTKEKKNSRDINRHKNNPKLK